MSERKVILYIAMSLDGYIAGPNGNMSFLDAMAAPGEDYGYHEFIETIDTVILGRKTYDWVMTQVPEFPHADKETYVITRNDQAPIGKTIFYSGNLKALINKLKQAGGKNIFIDGGAFLVNELLKINLIDEFIISIIPVLLGAGTKLFKDERPELLLELISKKSFEKGLVQLHYHKL